MKIFVYGTLRKGESNASLLKSATRITEQAWTKGKLYDTGFGYPALKRTSSSKVYGELYEVSKRELERLDQLESYTKGSDDNLYERIEQKVFTDDGVYDAYVYVAGDSSLLKTKMTNQDWKEYKLFASKKESVLYFAYGSCMDEERFKAAGVLHYFKKIVGKGVLPNYSLKFTHRSSTDDLGRADIVEVGGVVEGKVYEIPVEALNYLYRREGAPFVYRPTFVTIKVNGYEKQALTFTVIKKLSEIAPPEDYAEEIIRGGKEILSDSYLSSLKAHISSLNKLNLLVGGN